MKKDRTDWRGKCAQHEPEFVHTGAETLFVAQSRRIGTSMVPVFLGRKLPVCGGHPNLKKNAQRIWAEILASSQSPESLRESLRE